MIEVGRCSIIIRNVDLESESFKRFEHSFSTYNKSYFRYENQVYKVLNKDVYLPSSVGVRALIKFFPNDKITFNTLTTAKFRNIRYIMKNKPRNELQEKAIKFIYTMKNDDGRRSRYLCLDTGRGKTYSTIAAISQYKMVPMIVVDREFLANQWKDEFLTHTNIKPERIKILSGKASVKEALEHPTDYDIYIAMHKTLQLIMDESPNSLNILMNKLMIGFRVFDEAHTNFTNIALINALSNVEYTLYLSATPLRSSFVERPLYEKVFSKIPCYDGTKIDDISHYIDFKLLQFDSHPDDKTRISCIVKNKGFSGAKWSHWITSSHNEYFNQTTLFALQGIRAADGKKKTAIVLPTIEMIEMSKKFIEESLNIKVGVLAGRMTDSEKEEAKESMIFLTTTQMFGKAMNVKGLEAIINFAPITSEVSLRQLAGRLRYNAGNDHIFVDATDIGFQECRRQSYIRTKFYKKYPNTLSIKRINY